MVYRDRAARRNADPSTADLEDSRILGPWELWLSAVKVLPKSFGAERYSVFSMALRCAPYRDFCFTALT